MKYIVVYFYVLCWTPSFGQEFGSPDSRWIYNLDEHFGYIDVKFQSDTIISFENYNKFNLATTLLRQGDTISFSRPLFLSNDAGLVSYSLDGIVSDTLIDFHASPGDRWHYDSWPGYQDTTVITIVDTFYSELNNKRLKALSYTHHVKGEWMNPFVDTIYEYLGFRYSYIMPFDHFYSGFGGNKGGWPICFANESIGVVDLEPHFYYADLYPIDCNNLSSIVDVSASIGRLHLRPNPVVDYLYLNNMKFGTRYTVTSLDGCIRLRGMYNGKVDVTPLRSGIYFLIVDGVVEKFIKH